MPNDIYEYENLQEIEYGGLKIIVEAARRDDQGNNIAETYAKKSDTQASLRSGVDIITINNKSILTGENINLYNKSEIDAKFSAIRTIRFQIVDRLPETGESNIIYLLPEDGVESANGTVLNLYREYIYVSGKWEMIGKKEDNLNFKTINGHRILVDGPNDSTNIELNTGVQMEVVAQLPEPEVAEPNTFYLIERNGSYEVWAVLSTSMAWFQVNAPQDLSEIESNIEDLEDRVSELEEHQGEVDLTPIEADISSLEGRIETLENKPDPVVSQSITKVSELENDAGYLTRETLKIPYTELDDVDLDSIIVEGKYKITNARNYPVEGTNSGTLVIEEDNKELSEEWSSANIKAIRTSLITDVDMDFESSLIINTIEHTEADVHLQAGGEYLISGTLNGTITIDAFPDYITDENKEDTTIILNNVKLSNPTQNSTINYLPDKKKLIVVLKENSKNYIFNNLSEASNSQLENAALHSNNDLIITGVGGLSIRSNSGTHGIKGTEVIVAGNTVLHVSAVHDCIHGSKLVHIQYGKLLLEDGNDGIESKNSDRTRGTVKITGGNITIRNCRSNSINSNLPGIACGPLTTLEFFNNGYPSRNMTFLEDITMSGENTELTAFATYYGEPHVYQDTLNNKGEIVTRTELGTYVDGGEEIYRFVMAEKVYEITGYMPPETVKRLMFASSATKVTLLLNKVYIEYTGANPTILYSAGSSRISIRSLDDTVNYVLHTFDGEPLSDKDYDAIKSEHNIEVSGAGTLFASSVMEDAIDGESVSLKGDGPRYFINSGARGIKSDELYFGGEMDISSTADYTNIYALFNNTLNDDYNNADIFCRNGNKRSRGEYYVWSGFRGVACANSFSSIFADPSTGLEVANGHQGKPIYVRTGGTSRTNWITQYTEVDDDDLFNSKEITFSPWRIFFAVPTIANLDPTKQYILGFKNGQIGWLSNFTFDVDPNGNIPEDAVYDEDGNVFVDEEGNYLVIGD